MRFTGMSGSRDQTQVQPRATDLTRTILVAARLALSKRSCSADYFPPRTDFGPAVQQLEAAGVNIFPYINGRIFDVNSTSFLTEDGGLYCTMYPNRTYFGGDYNLTFYNETYGSNATFHVADPTTSYWQDKISGIVSQLVNLWNVSGVYIDQLGAAGPSADWTPNHNHSLGGGSWWVDGINTMIGQCKDSIPPTAPLVTESNAEPYMNKINGCVPAHSSLWLTFSGT
jgi:hypothetical protein